MRTVNRAQWKKPQPDSARLDALLDAAAVEFNARGVAGARLAHVARQVGVGRAALYYYVDSREDLAYRCYLRACSVTADDLAIARRERKGLARLLAYIRRALDPQRAPGVVLSEMAYLGGERREELASAHARNMRELKKFIDDGMADGSVRDCDAAIVSQTLFGLVSWVPLASEYVAERAAGVRERAAPALCDMIEHGIARDPGQAFVCRLDSSDFAFRPGNVFDRRDAAAHKVELLLQTASRLFNQRGIDGTSLDDVTAALGATKGAFYHHLPEKKALVVRCVQRAYDFFERFADAAEKNGRTGLEQTFSGLHLNVQAQASAQAPLSPLTGLEMLPSSVLASIRKRATRLNQRFEQFNLDGIADGSLREFDVRTLAIAGAGAFGWIPKWRDPESGPAPRVVADEIVALFAQGIRRRKK